VTEKDAHIVRIIADYYKGQAESLPKDRLLPSEKPERSKCSVCGSENCYFGEVMKCRRCNSSQLFVKRSNISVGVGVGTVDNVALDKAMSQVKSGKVFGYECSKCGYAWGFSLQKRR